MHIIPIVLTRQMAYTLLKGANYLSGGDAILTTATASDAIKSGNAIFVEGDILDAELLLQGPVYFGDPQFFQQIRIDEGQYRVMAKNKMDVKTDLEVQATTDLPSGIRRFEPGLLVMSPDDYEETAVNRKYDFGLNKEYAKFEVMLMKCNRFAKASKRDFWPTFL